MSRSVRLFVAAYPPLDVAGRWLLAAKNILPEKVRLTTEEQVHLTLVFLGEIDERQLPDVKESVERSAAGVPPFVLCAKRMMMLPERGQPRLIAVETDAPAGLLEIQRRLASRLALDRGKKHEAFLPHFTVARFAGAKVERAELEMREEGFQVGEVRLMSSHLRASGAVHEAVKVVRLG